MTVQTLTLGKRKFVVVPEKDFRRLQEKARRNLGEGKVAVAEGSSAEDRRDAAILRRRLAEMRRRGERPVLYSKLRSELGLS